jgi:hypothetical protein
MSEGNKHDIDEVIKYEGWEIHLKPILYFLFYLALATVLVAALMYAMFWFLEDRAKSEDEAARRDDPLAAERQLIPQKPILQLAPTEPGQAAPRIFTDHPLVELRNLKKEYDDQLSSYGWVDKNAGVVHIPIDRAKDMLLSQPGLIVSRPEGEPKQQVPAETKQPAGGNEKTKAAGSRQ